ncbi:Luminal-binding protein 3, partial [Linum grandiflorum]
IIAKDQGNRTTPSFVAFSGVDQHYERLIGEAAKNHATLNPGRSTFFDVKQLIGKKFHKQL